MSSETLLWIEGEVPAGADPEKLAGVVERLGMGGGAYELWLTRASGGCWIGGTVGGLGWQQAMGRARHHTSVARLVWAIGAWTVESGLQAWLVRMHADEFAAGRPWSGAQEIDVDALDTPWEGWRRLRVGPLSFRFDDVLIKPFEGAVTCRLDDALIKPFEGAVTCRLDDALQVVASDRREAERRLQSLVALEHAATVIDPGQAQVLGAG